MFSYRPPKGSCWGHALRPKGPVNSTDKLQTFFDTYFEPFKRAKHSVFTFTCELSWKTAILPNIEWAPDYLKPGNERFQRISFLVNLGTGGRVMFPMGITIPISPKEPASYEFLKRLSADAPFKMSPKHFQVCVPIGKKGNLAWRKPDTAIAARLQEVI
jgi:hypothetical protein